MQYFTAAAATVTREMHTSGVVNVYGEHLC